MAAVNEKITRIRKVEEELTELCEIVSSIQTPDELDHPATNVEGVQELGGDRILLLDLALKLSQTGCSCPVCDEATITEERLKAISVILDRNRDVLTAKKITSENESRLDEMVEVYDKLRNLYSKYLHGEDGESLHDNVIELLKRQGASSNGGLVDFLGDEMVGIDNIDTNNFEAICQRTSEWIERVLEAFRDDRNDISSLLAEEEEVRRALEGEGYNSIVELWNRLGGTPEKVSAQLKVLKLSPGLYRKYKTLESESQVLKRELISSVFSPIEEDILEWWEVLKPSSTAFDLEFEFADYRNHSVLNIWCVAGNREKKHAMGVLSDSQQDALSLAFYLAAHNRVYGSSMLWLDDPTDSLDRVSLKSFCRKVIPKLLRSGTQVVVVTHDSQTVTECCSTISQARVDELGDEVGFLQLNLEVLDRSKGGVSVAPHSWKSARERYNDLLDDVDERNARWAIGDRLRLANSLRVYIEHLYADAHDMLQVLFGISCRVGETSSDPKSTLSTYEGYLVKDLSALRDIILKIPDEDNGPSKGFLRGVVDKTLDACATLDKGSLNAGSHASAVIPSVEDLENSRTLIEDAFLRLSKEDPVLSDLFIDGVGGDPRPYLFAKSCE